MSDEHGIGIRLAAFAYLERRLRPGRDTITWQELVHGLEFEGEAVPLLGYRGIHRHRLVGPIPLSITTSPPKPGRAKPYDDELGDDGLIRYRYFGSDPKHPDNVGLRLAFQNRVPLIYFFGMETGVYLPMFPVAVVADHPESLTVDLHVLERMRMDLSGASLARDEGEAVRAYVTRQAKRRVHQVLFSHRVLHAYRQRCSMCSLRHVLEAAHIIADGEPRGDPIVPNGLALCTLHHAAFDAHILGVSPDCRVAVRQDILEEEDGPMLEHGIQRLDGRALRPPSRPEWRPDRDRLAERFETFRSAC